MYAASQSLTVDLCSPTGVIRVTQDHIPVRPAPMFRQGTTARVTRRQRWSAIGRGDRSTRPSRARKTPPSPSRGPSSCTPRRPRMGDDVPALRRLPTESGSRGSGADGNGLHTGTLPHLTTQDASVHAESFVQADCDRSSVDTGSGAGFPSTHSCRARLWWSSAEPSACCLRRAAHFRALQSWARVVAAWVIASVMMLSASGSMLLRSSPGWW